MASLSPAPLHGAPLPARDHGDDSAIAAREIRPEPGDAALLARLRAGDAQALDTLIERYWTPLFGYAVRRTGSRDAAADIVQDVFVRLWERRASWRPDGSVRGLLFRLTRNEAVSRFRRAQARARAIRRYALLGRQPLAQPAPAPAEDAELRAALDDAIDALPHRRREAFLLRMIDGLGYDEIATVMNTSRQTVANQLSRALASLRERLGHLLD